MPDLMLCQLMVSQAEHYKDSASSHQKYLLYSHLKKYLERQQWLLRSASLKHSYSQSVHQNNNYK